MNLWINKDKEINNSDRYCNIIAEYAIPGIKKCLKCIYCKIYPCHTGRNTKKQLAEMNLNFKYGELLEVFRCKYLLNIYALNI